ncbi:uncharacterized protein LOC121110946 isoform X3 [Gallus gallus]|uniref:uncharacterized protein LOC121110946 isoform X3 n=1 Tax=Gallus gallus TaxID=9031 RepID=UPI001F02E07C|nr:uncharacterized protein LOC121110946 isoform X3 [Gallus gallus]
MQLSFHLHRSDAPHEVRLFYSSLQHVPRGLLLEPAACAKGSCCPALAVLLQEQTEKQLRIAAVLGLSGFCGDSTATHLHRGRLQGRGVPARVPACSPALGKEEVCDGCAAAFRSETVPVRRAGTWGSARPRCRGALPRVCSAHCQRRRPQKWRSCQQAQAQRSREPSHLTSVSCCHCGQRPEPMGMSLKSSFAPQPRGMADGLRWRSQECK